MIAPTVEIPPLKRRRPRSKAGRQTGNPCGSSKRASFADPASTPTGRSSALKLDLGDLERYPTDRLLGFTDRLLALIPSLEEHTCSYHTRGGFVRRLRDGTWLGHM